MNPTQPQAVPSNDVVRIEPGRFPHTYWINLRKDGRMYECAVMKFDEAGATHYIQVNKLDRIDQGRLARIVQNPRAAQFPLFDLMNQTILQNGVNALTYFHQFVEVLSPQGEIFRSQQGMQIT